MLRQYSNRTVMMGTIRVYCIVVLSYLLISCNENKVAKCENYRVEVSHEAGELFQGWAGEEVSDQPFLPLPVYLTHMQDDVAIAIIGKNLEKGQFVCSMPIACMEYTENEQLVRLVIAIPADENRRLISDLDLSSFMMKHENIRYMIQEWFLRYRGLGKNNLISWKSASYAQTLLN